MTSIFLEKAENTSVVGQNISFAQATKGVTVDLGADTVATKFGALPNLTLKILPLGDSNTRGFPNTADNGGYRTQLWNKLANKFSNLDFIGRMGSGPATIDRDHEGRGGFTINELTNGGGPSFEQPAGVTPPNYGSIEAALAGNPDVVLLMAGTNDILQGDSASTAIADLKVLVDRITTALPNTQVLVASVIPNIANNDLKTRTTKFNKQISSQVVKPLANSGKNVSLVDIFNKAGLVNSDFQSDGFHLVTSGYSKLANVWYKALVNTTVQQSIDANIDTVTGSAYADVLVGDGGDNFLDGGLGNDKLAGKGGVDTFVVTRKSGTDIITDFQLNLDMLGLANGLSFSQLSISQGSGQYEGDALIRARSDNQLMAVLENVAASSLSASHFIAV